MDQNGSIRPSIPSCGSVFSSMKSLSWNLQNDAKVLREKVEKPPSASIIGSATSSSVNMLSEMEKRLCTLRERIPDQDGRMTMIEMEVMIQHILASNDALEEAIRAKVGPSKISAKATRTSSSSASTSGTSSYTKTKTKENSLNSSSTKSTRSSPATPVRKAPTTKKSTPGSGRKKTRTPGTAPQATSSVLTDYSMETPPTPRHVEATPATKAYLNESQDRSTTPYVHVFTGIAADDDEGVEQEASFVVDVPSFKENEDEEDKIHDEGNSGVEITSKMNKTLSTRQPTLQNVMLHEYKLMPLFMQVQTKLDGLNESIQVINKYLENGGIYPIPETTLNELITDKATVLALVSLKRWEVIIGSDGCGKSYRVVGS